MKANRSGSLEFTTKRKKKYDNSIERKEKKIVELGEWIETYKSGSIFHGVRITQRLLFRGK